MDYKQEYEELCNETIAILMTLQPSMMEKSVIKLQTAIAWNGDVPWLEYSKWQGDKETLHHAMKLVKRAMKIRRRQIREWKEGPDIQF